MAPFPIAALAPNSVRFGTFQISTRVRWEKQARELAEYQVVQLADEPAVMLTTVARCHSVPRSLSRTPLRLLSRCVLCSRSDCHEELEDFFQSSLEMVVLDISLQLHLCFGGELLE